MLETKDFKFDRHGIFIFLRKLNCKQFKAALKICIAHARLKKTKQPCDWLYIPTLTQIA